MKLVLCGFIVLLVVLQAFSLDASLVTGLSAKNAVLYFLFLALVLRFVVSGNFRPVAQTMQKLFIFLCGYAFVSWLIVLFAIKYPGYGLMASAVSLKSGMFEHAMFFLVFLYGLATLDDAMDAIDTLLWAAVFANVLTVLDGLGVFGTNIIAQRDDYLEWGRSQGAFGEANIHGAMVVLLLPAMAAKIVYARGSMRLVWLGAATMCVAALFMVASRGAMVGIVLGAVWGAYLLRRIISPEAVVGWVGLAAVVVTVGIISLSATYTDILSERLLNLSASGDVFQATSGRSEIWMTALRKMMEAPWTFITGWGFDVYSALDFYSAPHNTFLGIWFNLGLPGLVAFFGLFAVAILTARSAAERTSGRVRAQLAAFVIGFIAVGIAAFFVELHNAWTFIWAYAGMVMRVVADSGEAATANAATPATAPRIEASRVVRTRRAPSRA